MASVASRRRDSERAGTIRWRPRPCTVPTQPHEDVRASAPHVPHSRTASAQLPDPTAAGNTINAPEEPVTLSGVDQCSCMALQRA